MAVAILALILVGRRIVRRFRVYTGRYGGELTIGKISNEEFAQFKDAEADEIVEEFSDWDRERPWHEIDDLEHLNAPYYDCQYYIQEEDVDGNEIGDHLGPFEYNHLYGREAYCSSELHIKAYAVTKTVLKTVNVLQFFSEEKGSFGDLLIETEGDFDPNKLCIGVVETDLAMLIDSYYYDKIPIEVNYDSNDTIGKGYHACVGIMIPKYHDKLEDVNIEEAFEDMEED
jgi:hypothetical protein